jgi:hypothetical protein
MMMMIMMMMMMMMMMMTTTTTTTKTGIKTSGWFGFDQGKDFCNLYNSSKCRPTDVKYYIQAPAKSQWILTWFITSYDRCSLPYVGPYGKIAMVLSLLIQTWLEI